MVTLKLSNEVLFFQAGNGKVIVYGDTWGNTLLFSPDGQMFFQLHMTGFNGIRNKHNVSFENPHQNTQGTIHRNGDKLELDGEIYRLVTMSHPELTIVPLPTIREPEYLFGLPDKQYVYVSADKYQYSYESFKLFIGKGMEMGEVSIRSVDRYRDGGTTIITTAEGTLHSPTPYATEAVATWNNTKLKKLDPAQFHIVETDAGVRICTKN